jgi:hypothetical protein
MAHQPSPVAVQPVSRPSLLDLVCVAVLGAALWVTAQSVGGVARTSTVHPASTPHGAKADDCTTPAPEHTVAQANPLAPVTGDCGDAKAPAASPAH